MWRLLIVAALLGFGTACIPLAHTWDDVEDFPIVDKGSGGLVNDDPAELRVLTWNIKFAGARVDFFFDGWGDRVHMTSDEVERHLDDIVALVAEQDPDVLMTQEVDLSSKRSAYIDMVQGILDRTDFRYAAWVPVWHVDYVPQDGLGPVEMGQAVFSKYPITRNTRIDLPQGKEQGAITNYFYLRRAVQVVEIDVGSAGLTVINNHPTAYDDAATKLIHINTILDAAKAVNGPMVVGGDFNVVPPGTINLDNFEDQAPIETRGASEVVYTEAEAESIRPFYELYDAALPLEPYEAAMSVDAQRGYFTHSLTAEVFWQMPLDYLFTNLSWAEGHNLQRPGDGSPATAFDPMLLSDHSPMTGVLVLR